MSLLAKLIPNLEKIGLDFPLLARCINGKRIVYLDNGATSQKPDTVISAMNHFYTQDNANVHRGIHQLSQRATMEYENAHQVVADFIGASFEEIIFTRGTTESLNFLAEALTKNLQPGDEIVLSQMEHHSNLVPWLQQAKERKLGIRYIPITKDYHLDMEQAQKIITPKTKIVSITHMSNVLGTINDIPTLAKLAHKVGAVLIVDAAQSVPHLTIDVHDLGCDFLVFSGHKMYGPTGIGVLYGKKRLLEQLNPFQYGGGMIREVTFEYATWNDLPWKFEAGTPPIAEAIGLSAAVGYLTAQGMQHLKEHEQQLTQYTLQKLSEIQGLTIVGPGTTKHRGPVISFTLQGLNPHDVSELLDREGIAVRGGHHCAMPLLNLLGLEGVTRVSLAIYNTKDDIDQLFEAIHKAVRIFQ